MTQLSEPSNSYSDGVYSAKSINPTSDDNKRFINSYTSAVDSKCSVSIKVFDEKSTFLINIEIIKCTVESFNL